MLDPLSFSIDLPQQSQAPFLPTRKLLVPSPTHPDDYELHLDNSSIEPFTICARRAENKLIHSREAVRPTSALDFGHLFHECEEIRLRDGWNDSTTLKQRELVSRHFLSHPVAPDDHRTAARMTDLLAKYNSLYAQDMWPERVLVKDGEKVVERGFKVELCSLELNNVLKYNSDLLVRYPENWNGPSRKSNWPYVEVRRLHVFYTGRIDAILQDSNLLFVVDHKTSSTGGKSYEESFLLANQTRGYCWAAQEVLGVPVAGLMLNAVIVRPPTKTKATIPREEFQRLPFFYSQDSLREWHQNIQHIISDFVSCLVRGFFPMTGPKSFMSPCVYCEFHSNCQLPFSQRAQDLASDFYRDTTWNPLTED